MNKFVQPDKPSKQRLDTILVNRELCESREQAKRLILAGQVKVNQQVIDKPGTAVDTTADIQVKARSPYVSRGGEKLAKALKDFGISVGDRIALDGGISTGGFTDCLLQSGAATVYGIDVGYGQVAWRLQQDPRVMLRERTNLRHLTPDDLYGQPQPTAEQPFPDLGVVDVSFISLGMVLPALWSLLQSPKEVVLLVKPQFEVGRDKVGKKGVVRDAADQAGAIAQVCDAAQSLGWHYRGLTWSPITGPAGNIEYLLWLSDQGDAMPSQNDLLHLTQQAQATLRDRSAL